VVDAYRAAVQSGISPLDFWELTPYLTGVAIGSLIDGRTTFAWLTAGLSRVKKMPALEEITGGRKAPEDPVVLDEKSRLMFMSHNATVRH
jgi:hypothetical protein